jgi:uncharacterized membrane protein required for colicin V production
LVRLRLPIGRCYPVPASAPVTAGLLRGDFVDFGAFFSGLTGFDLVFFLILFGFFVLGFAQGTLRRLLGLGALMFSFLFAANLRDPLGAFLAQNWTQFPDEYAYMIGFGVIFLAAFIALSIAIQTFYKPQPLFEKARFVDEVIGGLLGMLEAVLLFTIIIIILDSFFLIPGVGTSCISCATSGTG